MKRVLWLSPHDLRNASSGGRQRDVALAESARAAGFRVTSACVVHDVSVAVTSADYLEFLPDPARSNLRSIVSVLPEYAQLSRSEALRQWIEVHWRDFDLIVSSHAHMLPYALPYVGRLPVVFDAHNFESALLDGHRKIVDGRLRKLKWRFDAFKSKRLEARGVDRASLVWAVSREDAEQLGKLADGKLVVRPNGTNPMPRAKDSDRDPKKVLFVGSLSYGPNLDALRWLRKEIWPRVLRDRPDARLVLVGRDPSLELFDWSSGEPSVDVFGNVESVKPYLDSATLTVLPFRFGGGTRLKVFEAMAAGVPIVATPAALAGIESESDYAWVGETAEQLSDGIVEILAHPDLRKKYADESRVVVQAYYWTQIGGGVVRDLYKLLR